MEKDEAKNETKKKVSSIQKTMEIASHMSGQDSRQEMSNTITTYF